MKHDETIADILEAIGANVRLLRTYKGWGQGELAEKAGVQRQYVWNIETRAQKQEPKLNTLLRISKVLGVSLATLLRPIAIVEEPNSVEVRLR